MEMVRKRKSLIDYTINKNRNATMCISVQKGKVIVNAPWYLKKEQIDEIVENKKKWIMEQIKEHEEWKVKQNQYVKLLGQYYTIKIEYRNAIQPSLTLEEHNIVIILPNQYRKIEKEKVLKKIIDKMYHVVATKEIEEAMERARKLLGFAPEDYEIKKIKKVLGRCSNNKTILINPDLVKYNKNIINYIVLHEFCHLKFRTHSKAFYTLLAKYEPNYKEYEKEILEYNF